jgi:hypothetical protein
MPKKILSKKEFETLSHFRYKLRRFLRFSEEVTRDFGITHLQYLMLLHIKGFKGRVGHHRRNWQSCCSPIITGWYLVSRCEKLGLVFRQKGVLTSGIEDILPPQAKGRGKLARMHCDEC